MDSTPDEPLIELAFLIPLVIAIPFAFVLTIVFLPIVSMARAVSRGSRVWTGLAGVATGPVAVFKDRLVRPNRTPAETEAHRKKHGIVYRDR